MVLTQTTSLSPGTGTALPANGSDRQTPELATPPSPQAAAQTAAAAVARAQVAPVQQASDSSGVGFTLHFDPDTQRMILEAREATTGFVINQMPPKYVVRQFSAQASGRAPSSRGVRLDSES